MNGKYIAVGTIVGAIFLFSWGGLLHGAVPLDVQGLYEFQDGAMVSKTVAANAQRGNGIYFTREGLWASVAFRPDMGDKTQDMNPYFVKEIVTDLTVAFLLSLLILAIKCPGTMERAGVLAMVAVAAGFENQVSDWNWYGFSTRFSTFEFIDVVGAWFLLGLILSALKNKLAPSA